MARQSRNPYMQTDMSYTSTHDLIRAYTVAKSELCGAAAQVWIRATEDIEMSFVEGLSDLDFDTLRKAVKGEDESPLDALLGSVCDTSPWVIIPHRARAVREGAFAMEEYGAFEGAPGRTLEEKVAGALYAYVHPKVQTIAQAALERRISWAMQNR
jgi:hypothetical protein